MGDGPDPDRQIHDRTRPLALRALADLGDAQTAHGRDLHCALTSLPSRSRPISRSAGLRPTRDPEERFAQIRSIALLRAEKTPQVARDPL